MGPRRRIAIFVVALALTSAFSCGRPTGVPETSSGSKQKLPFDREPAPGGTSPSQSLVPSTTPLPEGTSLVVRLQKLLSSASVRAGDRFEATLEEPVVVEEQTVIARGATVAGRVLDAKQSTGAQAPGYLRIALASVDIGGRTILIDTSSVFAKGGSRPERPSATGTVKPSGQTEAVFSPDRRLTFRLTKPADF